MQSLSTKFSLILFRIMATLDVVQQNKLQQDAANPNTPKKAEAASVRPGMGFSKSTNAPPKPSLRETMLAQKKAAMAAKNVPNLPARPGSAMSSLASPARTVASGSATNGPSRTGKSEHGTLRSRPDTSSSLASVSHGGLSVAPMRPTKARARPEITRPATAGPYSVRRPVHGSESTTTSPSTTRIKPATSTANTSNGSPKRMVQRPKTSQSTHSANSSVSHPSPSRTTATETAQSPGRTGRSMASKLPRSPGRSASAKAPVHRSSLSRSKTTEPLSNYEELTMVIPAMPSLKGTSAMTVPQRSGDAKKEETSAVSTPTKPLKVYEDPSNGADDSNPRPLFVPPVLGEVPVNEDALHLIKNGVSTVEPMRSPVVPHENSKQTSRLLDSGITRIQAKSLDVHLFRKLQGLLKDKQSVLDNARFEALLLGLFDYLEAPLANLSPEKVQDIKAQILVTINLMLKKDSEAFRPHVARGLQSLLITRSCYDARAHIVNGLLVLSEELVALSNPKQTTDSLIQLLQKEEMTLEGCRTLSMGLHVLKALLTAIADFTPSDSEIDSMGKLTTRCLDSSESGVRQDAVQLCVALHSRIGEQKFWEAMSGVKADPRSLITYYIVKKARESAA